ARAAADVPFARRGIRVACPVAQSDVAVVDANGRVHAALRALLQAELDQCRNRRVDVAGEVSERAVRLRFAGAIDATLSDDAARALRVLGGDAGRGEGDAASPSWLAVPRA